MSISSPNGGNFDSGELHVTWSASDADGDEVAIAIDYSPDGGTTWLPIASSSGSETVNLRVAELPGSSDARIRVTASDGFQEASAISESFQVADQPPLPFIGSPAPGTTLPEGERVLLSGGADDLQDGTLDAAALRWLSDRDGDWAAATRWKPSSVWAPIR